MTRVRRVLEKTCIVCGHNLGPYGRICDKCGSIQRPSYAGGAILPPDKFKSCEKCGELIPEDSQEVLCEACIEAEKPRPIIIFEEGDRYKKTRLAALAAASLSAVTLVGCSVLMVFVSGAWLVVLVAVSGVGLGVSGAVYMIAHRRGMDKIEYYAPIKPQPARGPEEKGASK